jgi:AAA domain
MHSPMLHFIASRRLAQLRFTVIDATNVQREARKPLVELAKQHALFPVAIVLDPPEALCQERNRLRPDRQFRAHVVRRQRNDLRRSLKGLQREGFRSVWVLRTPEDVTAVEASRAPLWTDRRIEHGPFDIVGDIHGCHAELTELLRDLGYTVAAGCASDPSLCGSSGLGSRHSTGSCAASRSTGSTNVSSGCSRWRASRSTRGCEPHLFGPRRKGTASGCRCFHAPGANTLARLGSRLMPRSAAKNALNARARAKDASRNRDERARACGRKSASRLRRENEAFGGLAPSANVRLLASRSLG